MSLWRISSACAPVPVPCGWSRRVLTGSSSTAPGESWGRWSSELAIAELPVGHRTDLDPPVADAAGGVAQPGHRDPTGLDRPPVAHRWCAAAPGWSALRHSLPAAVRAGPGAARYRSPLTGYHGGRPPPL